MYAWIMPRAGEANPVGMKALVAIDMALQAFHAKRRGSRALVRQLMDACLKEVCRRDRRPCSALVARAPVAG